MRFDPHKLDEIRARLPVSAVVGRKVALKKKGREFAGLSPFKTEKTPSFFVNDQKGFYHCFASGEHGDIFTFVMKLEGLSFPEAVERLADEAGVALPKPEPRDRARAEQKLRLHEIHTAAQAFFVAQLRAPSGAQARAYLTRRGLAETTIRDFGIGYAPEGRTVLLEHLKAQGFRDDELAASGLIIAGEEIKRPYDRFRNRVMFPISDLRDRVIAFGGRALSAEQPAKYLNSPETPIFHKGHVLFNAARARQRAHDTGAICVVEGYMDVVALAEAGITNAVAPLGTALTQDQMQQLWRFADEPLLCFDGDTAGKKAAHRAIDTALPALQPGKSLRFAFLPDGLDPDDYVRAHGVSELRALFRRAASLSATLWDREWGDGAWTTPEQRALLEKRLRQLVDGISDPGVRGHYQQMFRDRCYQAWRAAREQNRPAGGAGGRPAPGAGARPQAARRGMSAGGARSGGGASRSGAQTQFQFNAAPPSASAALRSSGLVARGAASDARLENMIISQIVAYPDLIEAFDEQLASLEMADVRCSQALAAVLSASLEMNSLDSDTLGSHLRDQGLQVARPYQGRRDQAAAPAGGTADDGTSANASPLSDAVRRADDATTSGDAAADLERMLLRHRARGLEKDLQNAIDDFDASGSDDDGARIVELKRLLTSLELAEAAPAEPPTP